jgi:hypothetical protein
MILIECTYNKHLNGISIGFHIDSFSYKMMSPKSRFVAHFSSHWMTIGMFVSPLFLLTWTGRCKGCQGLPSKGWVSGRSEFGDVDLGCEGSADGKCGLVGVAWMECVTWIINRDMALAFPTLALHSTSSTQMILKSIYWIQLTRHGARSSHAAAFFYKFSRLDWKCFESWIYVDHRRGYLKD